MAGDDDLDDPPVHPLEHMTPEEHARRKYGDPEPVDKPIDEMTPDDHAARRYGR